MAIIPYPKPTDYRGMVEECGICGCKSNLWSSNSCRLEGRLVCPGNTKYPELHEVLMNDIYAIVQNQQPDFELEALVIKIQKARAKFKSVPQDMISQKEVDF
jgi:hypothetical protein